MYFLPQKQVHGFIHQTQEKVLIFEEIDSSNHADEEFYCTAAKALEKMADVRSFDGKTEEFVEHTFVLIIIDLQ